MKIMCLLLSAKTVISVHFYSWGFAGNGQDKWTLMEKGVGGEGNKIGT